MKRILAFFVLLISLTISCEKVQFNSYDLQNNLFGKWTWTKTCGGFTGGCWYPSNSNTEEIEFTNNMRYIEKQNNKIIVDCSYNITDTFKENTLIIYSINLGDPYNTYLWFSGNILNIQNGDAVAEYKKDE